MGWEKTRVCHRILWFNWSKDSELWNRELWTNGITDIAVKPPGFWPGWVLTVRLSVAVTELHSQVAVKPMTLVACLFKFLREIKISKVDVLFCSIGWMSYESVDRRFRAWSVVLWFVGNCSSMWCCCAVLSVWRIWCRQIIITCVRVFFRAVGSFRVLWPFIW